VFMMWLMWCFIFVCGNEKSHFSRVEAKKYQYGYHKQGQQHARQL